ncbi:MAG: DUF4255 domain-containing protein [Paludibacteraceae bacterium]|nr:DUF4255 domain-containing protein [Paludibacteraceae bacterium]
MSNTIPNILNDIKIYINKNLSGPDKDFIGLAPIKKDGQENDEDVTITLLRIEEETSRKPQSVYHYVKEDDKLIKKANPDVCLNLYILIVSHAQDYETALLEISKVIYWMNSFQSKDCIVELQTLSAEQNNSLWQTLGVEIKPAVVYKVRMVTISSKVVDDDVSVVNETEDGSPVSISSGSGFWSPADQKVHQGIFDLTEDEKKQVKDRLLQQYSADESPWTDIEVSENEKDKLPYLINQKEKEWLIEALHELDNSSNLSEKVRKLLNKAKRDNLL